MKFGNLFEFHKIPEWYTEYLDYVEMRDRIDTFKKEVKVGSSKKLSGIYNLNATGSMMFVDYSILVRENGDQSPRDQEDDVLIQSE